MSASFSRKIREVNLFFLLFVSQPAYPFGFYKVVKVIWKLIHNFSLITPALFTELLYQIIAITSIFQYSATKL